MGVEVPRTPNYQPYDMSRVSSSKSTRAFKILDLKTHNLEVPEYGIFNQSINNEVDSLNNRHLLQNRVIAGNHYGRLQQQYDKFKRVVSSAPYSPLTLKQMLDDKRGALKKRYLNAHNNLQKGREPDPQVKAFIKTERFTLEKLETKPPRMIQHRSYEYLFLLNKYLKPLDKLLCTSTELIGPQTCASIFAKGKPANEIASQIKEHWDQFLCPVAICVDQKHFDAHYCKQLHYLEHGVWLSNRRVKRIKHLLNKQHHRIKGTTQLGIRYYLNGERCSGEYNTSCGNSLTEAALIMQVMQDCGITNFRLVVNGDDSIIFIEEQDLHKFNHNHFYNYGMDAKVDKICRKFEEIEFCQCSPVWNGVEYIMVRDPGKTIGKASLMLSDYQKSVDRYIASVGLCELALNRGIPMLQDFALHMIYLSNGARPLDRVQSYKSKFEPELTVLPITEESRVSFQEAFGVPISAQIEFETSLKEAREEKASSVNMQTYLTKYKNYHNAKLTKNQKQ